MLGRKNTAIYIRFNSCQIFSVGTIAVTFVGSNLL